MKNTKQKSTFQFLLVPSKTKKNWYSAFCFELGLIREGRDPLELKRQISKLAFNYYRSVIDNNLSDDLLNQELPKKYNTLLEKISLEKLCREWEEVLNKKLLWRLIAKEKENTPKLMGCSSCEK